VLVLNRSSAPAGQVIVSHDRTFVNNVITDVLHFENKALTYYKGDYDTFEKTRMEMVRLIQLHSLRWPSFRL
jgi:ATPase subunit of ABC transporter with duplicated ATPase domains